MSNTFASLSVPTTDAVPGAPLAVALTGRPKTFVLDGIVKKGGRYIVEGSEDGGTTWDILAGRDGTQVFFTSDNTGTKSVEAIVTHVRVRSEGNGTVPLPPSITIGAPPAVGTNTFHTLPVPPAGLGAAVDLGDSAGPLKSITLRRVAGPMPVGARYSILASMDGTRFDEIALFTADRQGTRSVEVMCRYVRVQRDALGDAPVIALGAEGMAGTAGVGDHIEEIVTNGGATLIPEGTVVTIVGSEVVVAALPTTGPTEPVFAMGVVTQPGGIPVAGSGRVCTAGKCKVLFTPGLFLSPGQLALLDMPATPPGSPQGLATNIPIDDSRAWIPLGVIKEVLFPPSVTFIVTPTPTPLAAMVDLLPALHVQRQFRPLAAKNQFLGATPTPLATVAVPPGSTLNFFARVTGSNVVTGAAGTFFPVGGAKRAGVGPAAIIGGGAIMASAATFRDDPAVDSWIDLAGNTARLMVKGKAGEVWGWSGVIEVVGGPGAPSLPI